MAISKLRFTQTKRTALAKQQRRLMADLLKLGKEESARIRVENIIREDIYIELLEMLELYCELLSARIALLDRQQCDAGLEEAVKVLIYSAGFTDLKELTSIKEILIHKFGQEFALEAIQNHNGIIPQKVVKRCVYETPSEELTTLYLKEIARAYNIQYSASGGDDFEGEEDEDEDDDDDDEGGKPILVEENDTEELDSTTGSTPRRLSYTATTAAGTTKDNSSPISVKPPAKNTDNLNPQVKIPQDIKKSVHKQKRNSDGGVSPDVKKDDLDSLRKRFEALKR
ncbi:hypothetical protein WICPIJ_001780 [Wickerhamomyces pijperi]|uniref:Vacuolar protein sorting-associated protein IST1 n=1 Tax=Wickerhamomyces pijperi TaxID=599730 RepID=A0A9P8QAZ4_WICPI|nr:hypothetical protein WICPIJ_001780 [Wickerhamomyces pijperi]